MIVGFSKYGKGQGTTAVDYFTRTKDREIAPTILSGDPDLVRETINQCPNEWKYTSGVLSWAPEDIVSEEQEAQLIEAFEETAFAGIDPENRPQGLWVRHQHADHHEMHFVYPRMLNDGRSYNMRPPNDQGRYDAFRDVHNLQNGWADPDDPDRQRAISLPNFLHKDKEGQKDIREALHQWAEQRIQAGAIDNRNQLIEQLKEQGLNVPRAGKNYITIEHEGERVRLKGPIYAEAFQSREELGTEFATRSRDYQAALSAKLEQSRERLASYDRKRAEQNQARYGRTEPAFEKGNSPELVENRSPERGDLSRLLDRHMGVGGGAALSSVSGIGGPKQDQDRDRGNAEAARRREASKRAALDTLRKQDLHAHNGNRVRPVQRGTRGLVSSEIERQDQEYERDLVDELAGRHWAIAARKRVNAVRESTDRTIGSSQSAVNGRKSIAENLSEYAVKHRENARAVFTAVHNSFERIGERVVQLKASCQPLIEKAQERARKLTRGFSGPAM